VRHFSLLHNFPVGSRTPTIQRLLGRLLYVETTSVPPSVTLATKPSDGIKRNLVWEFLTKRSPYARGIGEDEIVTRFIHFTFDWIIFGKAEIHDDLLSLIKIGNVKSILYLK
jgi:hypothetical protein